MKKTIIRGYLRITYLAPSVRKEIEQLLGQYLQRSTINDTENITYELICPIDTWQKLTLELAPEAQYFGIQRYTCSQIRIAIDAYQIEEEL